MKKFIASILCLSILYSFVFVSSVNLANAYDDDLPTVKALMIDVGGGPNGLSMGFGFRYWITSLHIGMTGFANSIPNYAFPDYNRIPIRQHEPLPAGYEKEVHTGLIFTADLGVHLDYFYPYTFFGTVGYYNQQDSLLAKETNPTTATAHRYFWRTEGKEGLAFGLGGNYYINDNVGLGVGLHTKRGIYGQFVYSW